MSQRVVSALGVLLIWVLSAQAFAAADRVKLEDAVRKALSRAPGYVQEAGKRDERGKKVWRIEIRVALNRVAEVDIDRESGDVVRDEVDSGATQIAKLDFDDAVKQARRHAKGDLSYARLKKGSRSMVWEFRFEGSGRKSTKVEIDAQDGDLIKVDGDDE
jgi:uncharacterized membrane protein YkoI